MGSGRFDDDVWASHSTSTATKPADKIFSKSMKPEMDPSKITVRESCDSVDNPNSNAIIVALDVTGSMGSIPEYMVKEGLGVLFKEIFARKPVSDPHVMFMGIGDVHSDRAPLQASQFEASNIITDQLSDLWLEGNGGGNQSESYHLPWYFAAYKTVTDCFIKRGKKGYLFTVGDEYTPPALTEDQIKKVFGDTQARTMTTKELFDAASRAYHVFHIVVLQGSVASMHQTEVMKNWRDLMGQNVIPLEDYTKLSEVIVSTIQVVEGEDKTAVASSWDGSTAVTVASAIGGIVAAQKTGDIVRL